MEVGFHSVINKRDQNQDYFRFFYTDDVSMAAVLDGHGPEGHLASRFFGDIIGNSEIWENKSTSDVISYLRERQHTASDFDMIGSGTTLVALIKRPDVVEVVNIGDSRMAIFVKKQGTWKISAITKEHKFHDPDEMERALRNGNSVVRGYVYSKDLVSGLNVSRSLGDLRFEPAVSSEPDHFKVNFPPGTKVAAVLASDGLWDTMQAKEVEKYLDGNPVDSAHAMVTDALQSDKTRDNITVIVTKFQI
jgi:adenylate cyclase